MSEMIQIHNMPILALRGLAVFPEQTIHFEVGRKKSVLALDKAMEGDQTLLLIPQKDIAVDDPDFADLFAIGTVAKVKQVLKGQGENIRVLVTGLYRAEITDLYQNTPYLAGEVTSIPEMDEKDDLRCRALRREANALYANYLEVAEYPAQVVQLRMMASESCGFIADSIGQNSGLEYPDKVRLLTELNPVRRLEMAVRMLRQEIEMLHLETDIQEKTRANIDRQQKDYYLREQLKVIREELGDDDESEFAEYDRKIRALKLEETSEKKLILSLVFLTYRRRL